MALTQIIPASPGQRIDSSNYNAEFNNIYNNSLSLISPLTGQLNHNLKEADNFVLENVAATPTSTAAGRLVYNTVTGSVMVDNGVTVTAIGGSGSGAGAGSRVKGLNSAISAAAGVGTFTADQIVFQSTNSPASLSWVNSATSGISVNTGVVGSTAGGRDTAAAFASTYVYFYAISTGVGSTGPVGIVSTKQPGEGGPTLPSSYSGWAFLAASPYTSSSSAPTYNVIGRGSWMYYSSGKISLVSSSVLNGTESTQALAGIIPPNSMNYMVSNAGSGGVTGGAGNIDVTHRLRFNATVDYIVSQTYYKNLTVASTVRSLNTVSILPNVNDPPVLFWQTDATVGTGITTLDIQGYQSPNGDV